MRCEVLIHTRLSEVNRAVTFHVYVILVMKCCRRRVLFCFLVKTHIYVIYWCNTTSHTAVQLCVLC
jgi:hypothetical protein